MKLRRVLPLLTVSLILGGCALPSYRSHPTLETRAEETKGFVLLPPRVEVFHLDTGGVREKMDEWSSQAKKNIMVAAQAELSARGLRVESFPEEPAADKASSSLEETHALFDILNTSIVLHTYSPPSPPEQIFEEKIKNFDYSLGEEIQQLRKGPEDLLVLLKGTDHVWTEGRKALQAFGVLLGLGAAVGTGVVVIPVLGGGTELIMAIVDAHTGSLLWYNRKGSGAGYDLRDPGSATSLVRELLKDLPFGKRDPIREEGKF